MLEPEGCLHQYTGDGYNCIMYLAKAVLQVPERRTLDMPSAPEDEQRCLKKYQVSSYFENGIW